MNTSRNTLVAVALALVACDSTEPKLDQHPGVTYQYRDTCYAGGRDVVEAAASLWTDAGIAVTESADADITICVFQGAGNAVVNLATGSMSVYTATPHAVGTTAHGFGDVVLGSHESLARGVPGLFSAALADKTDHFTDADIDLVTDHGWQMF